MSLACKDGLAPCSGCGMCLEYRESCDCCHRTMKDGDKYYRLSKKIICESCTDEAGGNICMLCRKPAKDGFRYKDIVLCRSCSGVATGYIGYI